MKSFVAIGLIGVLIGLNLSACTRSSATSVASAGSDGMSQDQKHRLYSAALAASESPLESETFGEVCKKIGIFDARGNQNDHYMAFVSAHIEWAMKAENRSFKQEINTREKAHEYLNKYMP